MDCRVKPGNDGRVPSPGETKQRSGRSDMSTTPGGINELQGRLSQAIREHWKLFLTEGIILVVLGLIAIVVPPIATIAVTILIGWLFLISGIAALSTTFWARHA